MRANVYSNYTTQRAIDSIPELSILAQRKWPKTPTENVVTIRTMNGEQFTSFARSPRSELKDLYVDFMAPELKSDLFVETWRRGAGTPLTSNCTYEFKVNNIESVELSFTPESSVQKTTPWSYLEDHSKWAVAVSEPTTCIGDINRMASQAKRGGGSVCFHNSNVWNTAKSSIHELESCPKNGSSNKLKTPSRKPGNKNSNKSTTNSKLPNYRMTNKTSIFWLYLICIFFTNLFTILRI